MAYNLWFIFWNCLEKWIHLFLPERFPNFWGLNRKCFENHGTLCSQKYPKLLIFFPKFYFCVVCVKISVTNLRDWPWFIRSISIIRLWMFLWWSETDSSFSRSSSYDGSLSFWISHRYLSCKCLNFLLFWELWSIQIRGQ